MKEDKKFKELSEQIKEIINLEMIEACVKHMKKTIDDEPRITRKGRFEHSSSYLQCIQFISLFKGKDVKVSKKPPVKAKRNFNLISWFKRLFK